MSLALQGESRDFQVGGIVIDDQYLVRGHSHASRAAIELRHWRGSTTKKVLPWPTELWTPVCPPCASTIRRVNASPRPVPWYLFAALESSWRNSENSFLMSSGRIPIPLSLTSRRNVVASSGRTRISTRPLSGVNFNALER